MTPRERNLALICGGILLVAVLGAAYMFVYEPLQAKASTAATLDGEVQKLEQRERELKALEPKLAQAKLRSLPADSNLARREYTVMMTRMLAKANIPQNSVTVKEKAVSDVRGIPLLANKKLAYIKVAYDIDLKNVDMWQIEDFLTDFYELNLLHQITGITIKHDENNARKGPIDRKDLTVNLSTEAIIVEGADNRPSLLPVPAGFAAIGGWRGHNTIAFNPDPEPARRIEPFQFAPVLASRKRDYSFLVRRDMFHGYYPDPPAPAIVKMADVSAPVGQPLTPVKLALSGDVPTGPVTWTAKAEGKLLTEGGAVKVDSTRQIVYVMPALGESGTGTVSVSATMANGKELKGSFKVNVIAPEPKVDISTNIVLVLASSRNDGTASAVIRDQFTPHTYEIDATAKEVKVQKYWYITGKKKTDGAPTPQLLIDDSISGTKRIFKVIAVDTEGLILADLTPPPVKPGMPAPGKFGAPGAKPGIPAPRMGDPTPTAPLSAIVGAPLAVTSSGSKLLRWQVGKNLKQLTELSKEDAALIQLRVEKAGPIASTFVEKKTTTPTVPIATPVKLEVAPEPRVVELVAAPNMVEVAPAPRAIAGGSDPTREKLIANLIASLGDVAKTNKYSARWGYRIAQRYAPEDKSILSQIAELETLPDRPFSEPEIERIQSISRTLAYFEDKFRFSKESDPKYETADLKILLDKRLIGDCGCSRQNGVRAEPIIMFLAKPSLSFAEVEKAYGKPRTSEKQNGKIIWNYSRISLIGVDDGKVEIILFVEKGAFK